MDNPYLMAFRIFKHFLVLILVVLPVQLLGMLLLPIILLFVPKDKEVLPYAFRWFDNAEIPLQLGSQDDGLAGPKYYREPRLAQLNSFFGKAGPLLSLYILRNIWLGYRNPINYFQHKTIGLHVGAGRYTISDLFYNAMVGNKQGDTQGYSYLEVKKDDKVYWEFYMVRKYKYNPHKCFRARIGWAIDKPEELTSGSYKRWVFTVTPWMDYEGL